MKARYLSWVAVAAVLAACDSPLDVNPTDAIDAESALTSSRAVELGVNGGYRSFQESALYSRELIAYPDLYADNLQFTGTYTTDAQVAQRNIAPSNGAILSMWADSYAGINRANNVLAALPQVSDLSEAQRKQYRGEALFIRALHYFDLVRYFGGVPIVTEPSRAVTEEAKLARSTAQEVYALIEQDLEEAAGLLSPSKAVGRATRGAANALLARVYLEEGKYAQARDKATQVIESGTYQLVQDYGELFQVENSAESIFELQYSTNNSNSLAFWFFPRSLGGRLGFAPTPGLAASFAEGDERLGTAIGRAGNQLYGTKYFRIANGDDNVPVLRLAEMYLIRAEANAQLGADPAVVRADINVVRERAGVDPLPATVASKQGLIDAILAERRLEFAMEGHRFFDLRRTGRAEQVLGIPADRLLFPIPQSEIDVNSNLQQNPGY